MSLPDLDAGLPNTTSGVILSRALRERREALDRLALLTRAAKDVVRDAGTDRWPVNLDRLRMALDEIGALEDSNDR